MRSTECPSGLFVCLIVCLFVWFLFVYLCILFNIRLETHDNKIKEERKHQDSVYTMCTWVSRGLISWLLRDDVVVWQRTIEHIYCSVCWTDFASLFLGSPKICLTSITKVLWYPASTTSSTSLQSRAPVGRRCTSRPRRKGPHGTRSSTSPVLVCMTGNRRNGCRKWWTIVVARSKDSRSPFRSFTSVAWRTSWTRTLRLYMVCCVHLPSRCILEDFNNWITDKDLLSRSFVFWLKWSSLCAVYKTIRRPIKAWFLWSHAEAGRKPFYFPFFVYFFHTNFSGIAQLTFSIFFNTIWNLWM